MGNFKKWWQPEAVRNTNFSIEIYTLKDARHTQFSFGYDRSLGNLYFSIGIWGLFCIFFGYEGKYAPQWRGVVDDNKEFSLRIFDGALWINLWEDPDTWTRGDRRWTIHPVEILFGRMKAEKVLLSDELTEFVEMPEKTYEVTVKVWRWTYWRTRLPLWKDIKQKIEIECEGGIPIPGKGESGWDLDDDAIFSSSRFGLSISEVLEDFRMEIIKHREKYGGVNWFPEGYQY
jgi:hypothetical protein